jgi:hypothetical protein
MEKVVEKTVPCVKEEDEDKSNLVHRWTQWGERGKVVNIGPGKFRKYFLNKNAIKPKIGDPLAISSGKP